MKSVNSLVFTLLLLVVLLSGCVKDGKPVICPPAGLPQPPGCEGGPELPAITARPPSTTPPAGEPEISPSVPLETPQSVLSTKTDGKESYGCFPSSCSLILHAGNRKLCQDWLVDKDDWNTPDCDTWQPASCTRLCEENTIQKYLPSEVAIYGRGPIWRPEDIDLVPTIIGWGVHLGDDEPGLIWLKGPKKAGAQHISAVSIWNKDSWFKVEDLPLELKGSYLTGFDGEPLFIQQRVFLNFLDPAFQQWIKEKMKLHIDAGTDGFVFDEHWATSQAVVEGSGPFDNYSLFGFRDYLKSKYSTDELRNQGIEEISTFNYRDFLVKGNYRDRYRTSWQNPAPLQQDYRRFLLESSNRIIKELIDYASSYAQQKGRTLKFAVNGDPLHGTDVFDVYDSLDLFVFEHEWFPEWRYEPDRGAGAFDAGVPASAKMKYAQTLGKPAVTMPYGGWDSKWFTQSSVKTGTAMLLHQFAEAYTNLGYYKYFDLDYIGFKFMPDRVPIKAYHRFIREHPEAFKDLKSYAEVALLRQGRVLHEDQGGLDGLEGFSHILGEANIPYDIVGLDEIGNYNIVLTAGFNWANAEVESMLSFAQNGGTLIASDGRFASKDENYQDVSRPSLQILKTDGSHNLGKGKFVFFNDYLWWKIWEQRDKTAADKILNAVKTTVTPNTAPDKVQLLPYLSADGRLLVHILNYDFADGDFTRKENFQVKVRLPAGYSAAGKKLTLISPDRKESETHQFQEEGGVLTFTVPSLYVWEIVILE